MSFYIRFIFFFIFIISSLNAQNFYSLNGVNKAYLLVEVSGKKIPLELKESIFDELKATTDELNIDTSGYSGRVIAFLINEKYFDSNILINIKLIVGEQVKREQSDKTVYADTYVSSKSFLYKNESALEENIEEAVYTLLNEFSEQYKEENTINEVIDINKKEFSSTLKYETDYNKALEKAKEFKKDVMLVLVSNYCPWCRKFEKEVLAQVKLNQLIHEKYIPLIINKETKKFPKELGSSFTPIVHFINYKNAKSYKMIAGYHNRDEFIYTVKNK